MIDVIKSEHREMEPVQLLGCQWSQKMKTTNLIAIGTTDLKNGVNDLDQ